MRSLLGYLRPYWKAALAAPALMMLEVFCDLLQPRLLADIIDIGIAQGDITYLIRTGVFMVGAALIGAAGGIGCTIYASYAAQNFSTDLRKDVYARIQSFSFRDLDRFHTASLITRLTNDITQLMNLVLMMLRILVRAPLMFVGGIIMACIVDPGLSAIALSVMPVLIVVLVIVIRKGFPLFTKVQTALDRVNDVVRENLAGIRVVKAFVRGAYEKERFGSANDELANTSVTAGLVVGGVMPLMMLLMNTSIVLLIWFGGIHVHTGIIAVGKIMALINYIMMILFSLMMSAMMIMNASRAKVSGDRVSEILRTEPSIAATPHTGAANASVVDGSVSFSSVYFRYPEGGADALSDISFTVQPGKTLAILGATGAGKSTLINLIPRFYDVTGGSVTVGGTDIRHIDLHTLRASMAIVQQETILFSGTIRDNIRWGRDDADDTAVEDAARAVQAHDFITGFPDGYGSLIGQRGVNLSGGQKQRIAIARALIRRPKILILDDSTSAVDMGTEARIQRSLRTRLSATACIVIAQRISSVIDADMIIILEDGRITATGTHTELIASSDAYREIYRSQMGDDQ